MSSQRLKFLNHLYFRLFIYYLYIFLYLYLIIIYFLNLQYIFITLKFKKNIYIYIFTAKIWKILWIKTYKFYYGSCQHCGFLRNCNTIDNSFNWLKISATLHFFDATHTHTHTYIDFSKVPNRAICIYRFPDRFCNLIGLTVAISHTSKDN